MTLCSVCHEAVQAARQTQHPVVSRCPPHHATVAELVKAAGDGCRACSIFWDSLPQFVREVLPDVVHREDCMLFQIFCRPFSETNRAKVNFIIDIECECDGLKPYLHNLDWQLRPDFTIVELDALYTPEPVSPSTIEPATRRLQAVRQCLDTCAAQHTVCLRPSSDSYVPSRLLDIATTGFVRLIERVDIPSNATYNTLSHCWGDGRLYKLTNETMSDLQQGVAIEKLPNTFQDAMQVTVAMSIRYIWIDSLCIEQDAINTDDWTFEAHQMDCVYSNGYCNICAADSKHSGQGLFLNDESHNLDRTYVDFPGDDEDTHLQRYELVETSYWYRRIARAPLHARAWVFQERLLARRNLHFTRNEVFFECCQQDASELYPHGIPWEAMEARAGTDKLQHRFKALSPASIVPNAAQLSEKTLHEQWWRLQEQYAEGKLTFPDDRTFAISGIAKAYQSILNDEYTAGMWKKHLALDLCWESSYVRESQKALSDQETKLQKYTPRAHPQPTFSWTSVDGPIMNLRQWGGRNNVPRNPSSVHIEVVKLDLQYATDDQTGLVKNGSITIRGRLYQVSLSDRSINGGLLSWRIDIAGSSRISSRPTSDRNREDLPLDSTQRSHYLLPACDYADGDNLAGSYVLFYILLEKIPDIEGVYRRIGSMRDGGWIDGRYSLSDGERRARDEDEMIVIV